MKFTLRDELLTWVRGEIDELRFIIVLSRSNLGIKNITPFLILKCPFQMMT